MAIFNGTFGFDNFVGDNNIADEFIFISTARLSGQDTIVGGSGNVTDKVTFTIAGTITAGQLALTSGIELIQLGSSASSNNNVTLTDTLVSSANNRRLTIQGGTSATEMIDARLVTSSANTVIMIAGAATSTFFGGEGLDQFNFTIANLTSADAADGGAGADTLSIGTAGTITPAMLQGMRNIETIQLANGTNTVVLTDTVVANMASVQPLTIRGGTGNDTVDASTVLVPSNDLILVSGAGVDNLTSGAGNDEFQFAVANLTSADRVNGGAGLDRLFFTTAGTITTGALSGVTSVESIRLANGTNTLTLTNALVDAMAGNTLSIDGNNGNDTIDASALIGPNALSVQAGAGSDRLLGGAGNDTFSFVSSNFSGADTVTGGAAGFGGDTLKLSLDSTMPGAAFSNVTGVEEIELTGSGGLTLSGSFVFPAAADLFIDSKAEDVTVNVTPTFQARSVVYDAGSGVDRLFGGSGGDKFIVTADLLTGADVFDGRGNNASNLDVLIINDSGTVDSSDLAGISNVERLVLEPDAPITVTYSQDNANFTEVEINGLLGQPNTVLLDFSQRSGPTQLASANSFDVTILFGSGDDELLSSGNGTLNVSGGDGQDTLFGGSGVNSLEGGSGVDWIWGGVDQSGGDVDILTGGASADEFVVNRLNAVDVITDFSSAEGDTISIAFNVLFATSNRVAIDPTTFVVGAAALDAGDRVIYNPATGALLYDFDGTGSSAPLEMASLQAALNLTAASIFQYA